MLWTSPGSSWYIYTVNIETGVAESIQVSYKASPADFYMVKGLLIYNGNYIKVK